MFLFIVCLNAEVNNLLEGLDPANKYPYDIIIFYKNNIYTCIYIAEKAIRDKVDDNNIFRGYFINDKNRKLVYVSNSYDFIFLKDFSLRGSYIHIREKMEILF